jgi:hypothetical protein
MIREIPKRAEPERRKRERTYGSAVELYLEPPNARHLWETEGPLAAPLDRAAVVDLLDRTSGLSSFRQYADEWVHDDRRMRVVVGDGRLIVRFDLGDETREALASRVDALFDFCFELGRELSLDLIDPQTDTLVSPTRYEIVFPRILDAYHRRARIACVLRNPALWTPVAPAVRPVVVRAIQLAPDRLPASVWGKPGRAVGILEIADELLADTTHFAVLPPESFVGDEVALLRIDRHARPVPGCLLVDPVSEGVFRVRSIERDPLRVTLA